MISHCFSSAPGQNSGRAGYSDMTDAAKLETKTEAEIVRDHDAKIQALARRFRAIDLDDLFQIGRLELLKAARTWEGRSSLWTYARRAVIGAMIDAVTREISREDPTDEADQVVDERTVGVETDLDVRAALEGLDADERRVVEMHIGEDRDFRSIAAHMGIGRSTASDIYQRAIAKLRGHAA